MLIVFVTGCTKKLQDDITLPDIETKNGPIPPYVFDWETTTYMPSQPAQPGVNPVPMPWNSGTTAIDPNIVSDYRKSEGWELVWNTFGPTILLNDPGYSYYFALYNRYRGY